MKNITKSQRVVIALSTLTMAVMALFPPIRYSYDDKVFFRGYNFLLNHTGYAENGIRVGIIDTSHLLVQWAFVLLVGLTICLLIPSVKGKKK